MVIKNKLKTNLERELIKLTNRLKRLDNNRQNIQRQINSHKDALEWVNKQEKNK